MALSPQELEANKKAEFLKTGGQLLTGGQAPSMVARTGQETVNVNRNPNVDIFKPDLSAGSPAVSPQGAAQVGATPTGQQGTWTTNPNTGKVEFKATGAPTMTPDQQAATTALGTYTPPESEADIAERERKAAQAEIDAIEQKYIAQIQGEEKAGAGRELTASAISLMSGLQGSPEAATNIQQEKDVTRSRVATLQAQKAQEINSILSGIRKDAYAKAQTSKTEARQSAMDVLALQEQTKSKAAEQLKGLSSKGIDYEKLKSTQPDIFNHILGSYGGNEAEMKADFIANAPTNTFINSDKPIVIGNTITYVKPDGTPMTITLPNVVDTKNVTVTKVGNELWTVNKATGEAKKVGTGTSAPGAAGSDLAIKIKENTIRNQDLMAVNRALSYSGFKTDPAIKAFLAASPTLNRVQSAAAEIKANGINAATGQELIDAVTQLNRGGGVISEANVNLLTHGQSYKDQLSVLLSKIEGKGGIISPEVAKDLVSLAERTYSLYEKSYQERRKTYTDQLEAAGLPTKYFPPDVSKSSALGVLSEDPADIQKTIEGLNQAAAANGISAEEVQQMIDAGYDTSDIQDLITE